VHDTWTARELPVLEAAVRLLEVSYMVTVSDIGAETGMDVQAVARALEALDPVYVDFRKTETGGDPTFWYVYKVTPAARQAVGQWPTAESFVDNLAAELAAAAQGERDPERKGLLTYAARLVGETLRDASVRAANAVLAPSLATMRQAEDASRPDSAGAGRPATEADDRPAARPGDGALP
jgi:hypothetical protein